MTRTEIPEPKVIKKIDISELTKEERRKLIHPKNTGDKDDISSN